MIGYSDDFFGGKVTYWEVSALAHSPEAVIHQGRHLTGVPAGRSGTQPWGWLIRTPGLPLTPARAVRDSIGAIGVYNTPVSINARRT
jgi:hypothetical protein